MLHYAVGYRTMAIVAAIVAAFIIVYWIGFPRQAGEGSAFFFLVAIVACIAFFIRSGGYFAQLEIHRKALRRRSSSGTP